MYPQGTGSPLLAGLSKRFGVSKIQGFQGTNGRGPRVKGFLGLNGFKGTEASRFHAPSILRAPKGHTIQSLTG